MINNCCIEGYIFEEPVPFSWNSGKEGFQGKLCCYRDQNSKRYDLIEFKTSRPVYEQLLKEFNGKKCLKIMVIGELKSAPKQNSYIFVHYIAICGVPNDLKYNTKNTETNVEAVASVDKTEADDGQETVGIGDDDLPF